MHSMRNRMRGAALVLLATFSAPGTIQAGDGRREISQAGVLAAGGFPFVISSPGSYVLTSDLAPPANVIGIQIEADDVAIDMNGFAIRGNLVCVPGSCTGSGPSKGIGVPATPLTNGRRCTVRNGTISGINGTAIELRDQAFVDAVVVSNTFFLGISLGPNSLATRNRISAVGRSGLFLGAGSGYAENVITATGQFFAFGSVLGGKPVGPNVCHDGRCPGGRRFYLTPAPFPGNQALTACDAGFHMASRWELQQVSTLRYDSVRGDGLAAANDQLPGPLTGRPGWIRTGSLATTNAVGANCNAWQSATAGHDGTHATLSASVPAPEGSFSLGETDCAFSLRVWCIEDD